MLSTTLRVLRGAGLLAGLLCGGSALAQAAPPAPAATPATAKLYFFVRLIPPRPTFLKDMTTEEGNLMGRHAVYWTALFNAGKVLVFGPVQDPKGDFGMAVVEVGSREEAQGMIDGDPSVQAGLNKIELAPMRVALHR